MKIHVVKDENFEIYLKRKKRYIWNGIICDVTLISSIDLDICSKLGLFDDFKVSEGKTKERIF